jgi:hypothetical protein
MHELKATLLDDDAFSLRIIPFSGPIPHPKWPGGVDVDGETFTHRTDIKARWFDWRAVDWHHGQDPTGRMGRNVIGKAGNLRMEEDGWWEDVWLDAGEARVELIRKLAARTAIYGSSEAVQGMTRVNKAGHIDVWPHLRSTLSTSPQNTHAVIAAKANLTGIYSPTRAFWDDVREGLRDLVPDLSGATAGRSDVDPLGSVEDVVARLSATLTQRAQEKKHHGGRNP